MSDQNERFKKMVEDSQDWFWEFDENANFTYASPRIRDLLGYEPEELIGVNAFDLMAADEAARVRQHFDPICQKYLPFKNLVNINIHKDGHEVVIESSGTPIFDNEGRFCGYRGIDRDITKRSQLEQMLQVKNSKLVDILETSTEWIWEMDLSGCHTYSNRALGSFLGYSIAEFVGRSYADFIHADDLAEVERILPLYIKEKRGWLGWLVRWRHKDGSYLWLESNAKPVVDASGQVIGFRGADRDVTQRKRLEEQLLLSRGKLKDILTLLPQTIYEADFGGRLIYANQAAFDFFGYSDGDFSAGLSVLDMVVLEDLDRARENIGNLYMKRIVSKYSARASTAMSPSQ